MGSHAPLPAPPQPCPSSASAVTQCQTPCASGVGSWRLPRAGNADDEMYSDKERSRNAIKHLQSRVQKMPCYKPVKHIRRGTQPFNIGLYEDFELEQHLVLILANNKRTVANRRTAIESILMRFVSVNKDLFPEFRMRDFQRIFVPA